MRRHVRIEYTLRPEVDVDAYKTAVAQFVRDIHTHAASSAYAVYQHEKDARRFTHLGAFDPEIVPTMQKQAWFETFTAQLRQSAVNGPDVQSVAPVAST